MVSASAFITDTRARYIPKIRIGQHDNIYLVGKYCGYYVLSKEEKSWLENEKLVLNLSVVSVAL